MKKEILKRYRRDAEGLLVIDIAAEKVNDLYDDFDKHAPFVRKELDYDLVEYLIESAHDLGREPFSVNFSFIDTISEKLKKRISESIENYFEYLLSVNSREIHVMFRSSFILLVLGLVMLSASIYINHAFDIEGSVAKQVLVEGLVIASWVSMWEAISGLLLHWPPLLRERFFYRRLKNSKLTFCRIREGGNMSTSSTE